MTGHHPRRWPRAFCLPTVAFTLAGVVGWLSGPGVAVAEPVGTAQARATALRLQVAALQTAAEIASQRYDAAEAALGRAVTGHVLSEQQLAAAQQVEATAQAQTDARVRALYQSGGPVVLVAEALNAGDLADVMTNLQDLRYVVRSDQAAAAASGASVDAASRMAATLGAGAGVATRLQQAAATAAAQVQATLAQSQAALAGADAQVRALVVQQQQQAAAAAAAAAQATLEAAQNANGLIYGTTVAPTAAAAIAINAARSVLGDPYVWGATGPDTFDCSGLTQWAYARAGVALPRVAADQYDAGPHVSLGQLQPGDLLFWATDITDPTTIHHVAIYVGAGMMIEAPHTGAAVRLVPVYLDGYIGATRVVPATADVGAPGVSSALGVAPVGR